MTMPPGAAYATIGEKNGRGRNTRQSEPVRHVEASECRPAFGMQPALLHELEADSNARITCRHCHEPWSVLDQRLNDGLKSRERR